MSGYCEFESDNPNVTFDKGKLTIPASEKGNTIIGTLSYAGGELSKDISIAVLYHCTIEYAGDAVTEDAQTVFSGTEITLPDAPEQFPGLAVQRGRHGLSARRKLYRGRGCDIHGPVGAKGLILFGRGRGNHGALESRRGSIS